MIFDENVITGILFAIGFVLLIGGAEVLVRGASKLAVVAGISPLVVGLTVVAYGTSAPELAVTVQSSYAGQPDIAIGNVVGSNIANILLILGIAASVAPLVVSKQLVRLDVPIMIAISAVMLAMAWDGVVTQIEGGILVAGAVGYSVFAIELSRKQEKAANAANEDYEPPPKTSFVVILKQIGLIVVGLALLVVGARWLVNGATALAQWFGVSELIIALTIVAVGTSLPEIATSVIASLRGERDIAVGNAVGSNIFNILLVLGVCAMVAPGAGVPISPSAVTFDIPIMIAVAVACLPIFFTGYAIKRWEGLMFLAYYGAYTTYLYLSATRHSNLDEFGMIMGWFVIPLTVITLAVLLINGIRHGNHHPSDTPESHT